jgi:DNA polymerase V
MNRQSCIGLVDLDNCYYSCQAVFEPSLEGKPVFVLSANDGNVIARSRLAKMLGVPMGAPVFEFRQLVDEAGGIWYSANLALYADMSRRVSEVLATFVGADTLEQYSVDEVFTDLTHVPVAVRYTLARNMRATVRKWTGLTVSIGLGETKTVAKLAGKLAKSDPDGVVDLTTPAILREVLARTPVSEIWGIGNRRAHILTQAGIHSALQLRETSDQWIRRHLHVDVLRLVYELRGEQALPLVCAPPPPHSIMRARAFGRELTELADLQEAVALFVCRASEKLRAQQRAAQVISVFLCTNRFRRGQPQYHNSCMLHLPTPTNITPELVRVACAGLSEIYRSGFSYHRAGILLTGLVPATPLQLSLYEEDTCERREKRLRLIHVLDTLNERFGRDTVRLAAVGYGQEWRSRAAYLSPRFTTRWKEIMVVCAQ